MRTTRSYKKALAAYRDPPFRFLSLPVELRLQIYRYLLAPNGDPDLWDRFFHHEHPYIGKDTTESTSFALAGWAGGNQVRAETKEIFMQILSVCKAIHDEAYPIFYNNHLFRFRGNLNHSSGHLTFETDFFNRLKPNKAMQLRHIEMEIDIKGAHSRRALPGFRTSRYNSMPRLLDFLERNKASLNLHSCTITTDKISYNYLIRPPLPLPCHDDYAAQIQQLWNLENSEEKKSMWEAVLKICKEIFPDMVASREVKDVYNIPAYFCERRYKAVARKG